MSLDPTDWDFNIWVSKFASLTNAQFESYTESGKSFPTTWAVKDDGTGYTHDELLSLMLVKIEGEFRVIKIPKGTLMFHSNQFLYEQLEEGEPVGGICTMDHFRRYGIGQDAMLPRLYMNFTPYGTLSVVANMVVSVAVYKVDTELTFVKVPAFVDGNRQISFYKDLLRLTKSMPLRKYAQDKGYAGFYMITAVDAVTTIDPGMGVLIRGGVCYPEALLIDKNDHLIKIGQYDILDKVKLRRLGITNSSELMEHFRKVGKSAYDAEVATTGDEKEGWRAAMGMMSSDSFKLQLPRHEIIAMFTDLIGNLVPPGAPGGPSKKVVSDEMNMLINRGSADPMMGGYYMQTNETFTEVKGLFTP